MDPKELLQLAKKAMAKAYVPYSDLAVGAAVLTESGKVITGCNVENASFGLSMCAERVAVFKAVSEGEKIEAIAVVSSTGDSRPCGACRQVIYELNKDAIIYFITDGELAKATAAQLLPETFFLQTRFREIEPS